MEGQDMPLKCKGYGGYEIRIDYSAAASNLRVQLVGDKTDQSITLGMQPMDYDQTRKVEWRLANGKPFAVIYRMIKSKTEQPEEMWRPENMAGEFLVIKGLKGFEQIDLELDAKLLTPTSKPGRWPTPLMRRSISPSVAWVVGLGTFGL